MTEDLQRSDTPRARGRRPKRVARMALPSQQRAVLDVIVQYYRATNEACPAALIARKTNRHHSTIQGHLSALFAKGWLRTPNAPASPTHW